MSARDAYHHGNLRRALLDESLRVIAEKGVEGLSLRDVAGRIGVSHAAPYHHFADKPALLRALADEGMAAMDDAMAQAAAATADNPRARLLAIGRAYVTFAVSEPAYYAAFTSPDVASGSPGPLREGAAADEQPHGEGAWGRLLCAVLDCQASGDLPAGDPVALGVYLWALVHGLAELWRLGSLRQLPQAARGLGALADEVLAAALGTAPSAPVDAASWAPCP